ncbi:MAG: glycosyltransferase family 87 protein [Gemmataceae bacterium]
MNATTFSRFWTVKRYSWFLGLVLLVFVGISVQYTAKIQDDKRDNRSAFLRWRGQILDLDAGYNIYHKHTYPNPPIMALVLRPFVALPPMLGALTWFFVKVGMVFLIFRWVFFLVEDPDVPIPPWAKVLTIVLSMRPILGDLTHGNVNLFIMFLVVGALYCFRRGRDYTSGLLLGFAIACKITPALFLPYFAWKRGWKVLAGCGIGLVLFLFVVPSVWLGPSRNARLLNHWVDQMVVPYVIEGRVTTEHQNQSLPGLTYRMLSDGPSFSVYTDGIYVPTEYHNIANVNHSALKLFLKVFGVGFLGLMVWSCRTPITDRKSWRLAAEYGFILIGMLILSERTWKHHCVSWIIPFAVMIYYLHLSSLKRSESQPTTNTPTQYRSYVIVSLFVVVALVATTSTTIYGPFGSRMAKLAQVYGAYVWAHMILIASLVVLLWESHQTRPPETSNQDYMPQRSASTQLEPQRQLVATCSAND